MKDNTSNYKGKIEIKETEPDTFEIKITGLSLLNAMEIFESSMDIIKKNDDDIGLILINSLEKTLEDKTIKISPPLCFLSVDNILKEIKVSDFEFKILRLLSKHQGQVLNREFILNETKEDADNQYLYKSMGVIDKELGKYSVIIDTPYKLNFEVEIDNKIRRVLPVIITNDVWNKLDTDTKKMFVSHKEKYKEAMNEIKHLK